MPGYTYSPDELKILESGCQSIKFHDSDGSVVFRGEKGTGGWVLTYSSLGMLHGMERVTKHRHYFLTQEDMYRHIKERILAWGLGAKGEQLLNKDSEPAIIDLPEKGTE